MPRPLGSFDAPLVVELRLCIFGPGAREAMLCPAPCTAGGTCWPCVFINGDVDLDRVAEVASAECPPCCEVAPFPFEVHVSRETLP